MEKDIQKLVESHKRPSLVEILPLAKKRNLISPPAFWDFFDKIQSLWAEKHRYYDGAE